MAQEDAAKEDHLRLADVIKGTHARLREEAQRAENDDDQDQAWQRHADSVMGSSAGSPHLYAEAMARLAVTHWGSAGCDESRIDWFEKKIRWWWRPRLGESSGKARFRAKGLKKVIPGTQESVAAAATAVEAVVIPEPISILDVGSCFNPLADRFDRGGDQVDVVAVDLSRNPARKVWACDFLRVPVKGPENLDPASTDGRMLVDPSSGTVVSLGTSSFDCVVFSLLLEYLPLPRLRWEACLKAKALLKPLGLLLIATPDSSHQGKNDLMMKKWKLALAKLGFVRVAFDKLRHLRCMAFAKVSGTPFEFMASLDVVALQKKLGWADVEGDVQVFNLMEIPQDRTTAKKLQEESLVDRRMNDADPAGENHNFEDILSLSYDFD